MVINFHQKIENLFHEGELVEKNVAEEENSRRHQILFYVTFEEVFFLGGGWGGGGGGGGGGCISGKLKFVLDFLLLNIPLGMFKISLSLSLICLF